MSNAVLMERSSLASLPNPAGMPGTGANFCVLPRCEMKFSKCKGGIKIECRCEDELACATLQNLCKMLAGGLCGCCVTCNGVCICQCNFAVGTCKCEMTKEGCCVTCTSGDEKCCEMLEACCECCKACCQEGCCCYLTFNGTPVCCCVCQA
jgi:hypothetical protein